MPGDGEWPHRDEALGPGAAEIMRFDPPVVLAVLRRPDAGVAPHEGLWHQLADELRVLAVRVPGRRGERPVRRALRDAHRGLLLFPEAAEKAAQREREPAHRGLPMTSPA